MATAKDQISKALRAKTESEVLRRLFVAPGRIMRIAKTEVNTALNTARHYIALSQGKLLKIWISTKDSVIRESHKRIEGHSIPIASHFLNGLLYPGDPSGSSSEIIHCRCFCHYV